MTTTRFRIFFDRHLERSDWTPLSAAAEEIGGFRMIKRSNGGRFNLEPVRAPVALWARCSADESVALERT